MLGKILVVLTVVIVLLVISLILKQKSELKNQQKKNRNAWGRLNLMFQAVKINYNKCKEIVEGLDQNCVNEIWEEMNLYFKSVQINEIENLINSINNDLEIENYSLQIGLVDRLKILEKKLEEAHGWLRSVEAYPELIVNARDRSRTMIVESKEMIIKLEKMINNHELAVPKKIEMEVSDCKTKLLSIEDIVQYWSVSTNWFKRHRELDNLQKEIGELLMILNELNFKRDKCLSILNDIFERTNYWTDKKTKYNDESISRLASEAEDLYDQVLRILGNKVNYKSVSTDWNLIYSKLTRADGLDKKARLLYEEYELWK